MIDPKGGQLFDHTIGRFAWRTPYIVQFEPLIITGGEDIDGNARPLDIFLSNEVAGLLDSSERDDALDWKALALHDVRLLWRFGHVRLESRFARRLFDEPQGREIVARIQLCVIHADVFRSGEVFFFIDAYLFERNDAIVAIVGIFPQRSFCPSAGVDVCILCKPRDECRLAHTQLSGYRVDSDTSLLQLLCFRKLFFASSFFISIMIAVRVSRTTVNDNAFIKTPSPLKREGVGGGTVLLQG